MFSAAMRRNRLETAVTDNGEKIDRISNLPDHIIHHVMSFLPTKDAVRTSALSKKFRSTWTSFPIIEFNETCASSFSRTGEGDGRERFLNFMHDSLQRRPPNILLQKFKFDAFVANRKSDNRIDEAISYALENKVKELDLDIHTWNINGTSAYNFPSILFPAKSVTFLKLQHFNLENLDLTKFPSVEEFSLRDCNGLRSLKVSNPELKIMTVDSCDGLVEIDIGKSNLRSFSFSDKFIHHENAEELQLKMDGAKSLHNLSLWSASITDKCLMEQVSELLLLENLTLRVCDTLRNICIPGPSLKALEIRDCAGLEKIEILAPNLESFIYEGGSGRTVILISTCKFLKKLELYNANVTDDWVGQNVSELSFLENLILSHCDLLERIRISHETLKSIQLLRCLRLEEAEIHGRNLVFFRYKGRVIRSPLLVDSPGLVGQLHLDIDSQVTINAEWYKRLRDFLGNFDHCKLLMIKCNPLQFFIFPEDVREHLLPPLFDIKHLKVNMYSPPQDVVPLVESLLWLSPLLETMSIVSRFGENTIKLQYAEAKTREAMEDMDKDPTCCSARIIKCWRHYLSNVLMENFNNSDNQRLMDFFKSEAVRLKTIVSTQTTPEYSESELNEDDNEEDDQDEEGESEEDF